MNAAVTNRTPAMVKSVDHALEGPEFHGKPLIGDPYCLPCRMYFKDHSADNKKTVWPIKPWPDAKLALIPDHNGAYKFTYAVTTRLQEVSGEPWKQGLLVDIREGVHAAL